MDCQWTVYATRKMRVVPVDLFLAQNTSGTIPAVPALPALPVVPAVPVVSVVPAYAIIVMSLAKESYKES